MRHWKPLMNAVIDTCTVAAAICAVALTVHVVRSAPVVSPGVQRDTTPVKVANWAQLAGAGHRIGARKALLTIVEFGDFECPACGAFEKTLMQVRQSHPNDVAVIFRHWPLTYHHNAYPAARAAECAAAAGRFTEFHDILYAHQDSLGIVPFREFARRAGVNDLLKFDTCMLDTAVVPAVERDIAAAKAAGGTGTPTVIVNGLRLVRIPDVATLEADLERARKAPSS